LALERFLALDLYKEVVDKYKVTWSRSILEIGPMEGMSVLLMEEIPHQLIWSKRNPTDPRNRPQVPKNTNMKYMKRCPS